MPQQFTDVRLPKVGNQPNPKLKELAQFLITRLQACITARQGQLEEKFGRWEKNYNGEPKLPTRTTPFYNASNFVSGMIRMHTDIYHARIMGFMCGVKPFWQPAWFTSSVKHEWLNALADWLDYTCWNRMQFFEPLDTTFHSLVKLGTVVVKAPWVEKELWKATTEREGQGQQSTKQTFSNVCIQPIHYSDFLCWPINARTLETVNIKYHRLRYTEDEVRYRQATRGWDKDATDLLLKCPVGTEGTVQTQIANKSGIQLTPDVTRPYQVIECHLDFELQTGKLFPIVVLLNPHVIEEKSILRAYHKTYPELDLDEFIDFHFTPGENQFWKSGIPAILEGHFEEHTQLHNNRRDSSTIANIPTFKKKRFANVANPNDEWYPGKVWELDQMTDLDMMSLGTSYNHMIEEEHEILGQAERLVGNPPPTQGMGSGSMGKRGTYNTGGTLALLGEGNRRLDVMLMRCRFPMHKVGRLVHTSYRDFGDEASLYPGKDANDANLRQALTLRPPSDSGGLVWYGLNASNSSANREVERTSLLMAGNTMASYYGQLFQTMQMVVAAPEGSPLKQVGLMVLDGARSLAESILRAFNVPDRNALLPDLREVLGGGQPQSGPPAPGAERLPPAQGNVQPSDLSSLSANIATIAAASRGGGTVPQGGLPV